LVAQVEPFTEQQVEVIVEGVIHFATHVAVQVAESGQRVAYSGVHVRPSAEQHELLADDVDEVIPDLDVRAFVTPK